MKHLDLNSVTMTDLNSVIMMVISSEIDLKKVMD